MPFGFNDDDLKIPLFFDLSSMNDLSDMVKKATKEWEKELLILEETRRKLEQINKENEKILNTTRELNQQNAPRSGIASYLSTRGPRSENELSRDSGIASYLSTRGPEQPSLPSAIIPSQKEQEDYRSNTSIIDLVSNAMTGEVKAKQRGMADVVEQALELTRKEDSLQAHVNQKIIDSLSKQDLEDQKQGGIKEETPWIREIVPGPISELMGTLSKMGGLLGFVGKLSTSFGQTPYFGHGEAKNLGKASPEDIQNLPSVMEAPKTGGMGAIPGIAAILAVAPQVHKAVNELLPSAANAINSFNDSLNSLKSDLGPLQLVFDTAFSPITSIKSKLEGIPLLGPIIAGFVDQAMALPNALKDAMTTLMSLSQYASPVLMEQFQIISENAMAVVGRAFIPIMTMIVEAARFVADAMATVIPSMNEVGVIVQPLREAWDELRSSLTELMSEVGPILKSVLIVGIRIVVGLLSTLAGIFTTIANTITTFLKPLRDFLELVGLVGPAGMGSSAGASVQAAQVTSLDQYQQQLWEAAFSMPGASSFEGIVEDRLDRLVGIADTIRKFVEMYVTGPMDTVSTAASVASPLWDYNPLNPYMAWNVYNAVSDAWSS